MLLCGSTNRLAFIRRCPASDKRRTSGEAAAESCRDTEWFYKTANRIGGSPQGGSSIRERQKRCNPSSPP